MFSLATTRSELNVAMRELSEIIWKEGGFRFKHMRTNQNFAYTYHYSQDLMHTRSYQSTVEAEKQRDGGSMALVQK